MLLRIFISIILVYYNQFYLKNNGELWYELQKGLTFFKKNILNSR